SVEAAGFGRALTDAIAFLRSAGGLAAANIGAARVVGGELRAAARWRRTAALSVEYTLLDAVNLSDEPGATGKQLPGRARHELAARLDVAGGPFAAFWES